MVRITSGFLAILFAIWTALIASSYGENFVFPGDHENIVFDEVLWGLALVILSLFSGNRLLKAFRLEYGTSVEESLFSVGIGCGLLSTSIFILGVFKLFHTGPLLLLLLGLLVVAASNYEYGKALFRKINQWAPSFSSYELILLFLIFGFASLTMCSTLTPPISRDALIHHLAIPKRYIAQHGIVDVPFSMPSYNPPFMEMLYTGSLLLSSDILAQLLHFFFYVGSLFFTYALGRRVLPRSMSMLAVLLFDSLPVVCRVSSFAYSDLGLTFFTLGGFFAILEWSGTRSKRWLILGAIMTGLAVCCKYNGFIVLVAIVLGIIFTLDRWRVPLKLMIGVVAFFLLIATSVNTPWLVRNSLFTGNPIYPLAKDYLGKPWLPDQPKLSQYQERKMLWGETLRDQISLPWNLSVKTTSKARYELDGVINPIFLVFLPVFVFSSPKTRSVKMMAGFCLLYFLLFWASSRVRLRYLIPIYPFLGIITSYTFYGWRTKGKKLFIVLAVSFSILLNLYWLLVYTSSVNPMDFLTGKENREAFLTRHIPSYPVFKYVNTSLPQNARVMFLYGGNYGNDAYYLDRDYFFDSRYLGYTGKIVIKKAATPEEVRQEFSSMGITHLLINWQRLRIDFESSLPPEKLLLFRTFCLRFLQLQCKHGGSFLYRLL
jgi:hypothetical protein